MIVLSANGCTERVRWIFGRGVGPSLAFGRPLLSAPVRRYR
ncbi:hypothetical protein [Nocardiopsis lambiniae]|uniref:Uncharacterized protein n=1 Tax=Nocardiopsis lambiniae TaxID=3075539 RepID=A0ABU2MIN4_9ACTN|nr:hypothetical protein [Nocardiopsis sp. DSM 44743]MDT0332111.1 hypothetical protein [Nocardiopsis sp. DSM 44743]